MRQREGRYGRWSNNACSKVKNKVEGERGKAREKNVTDS